ncbi:transcriptional regulator GcvA [Reyranella sp. CPCC 100927]|uniref:transcriptional regulator GcvA n=1 Tax=Reyranella sp. CPCC 100927 TaxID=2599616 RepID=UPI0011B6A1B8|nr:transcriptional regulator GcvA [Reyranella sp. CPCC 100927]TWS99654.1 transcriptional regulator GcvA [Reyranella sp. CPCC 100927]
MARTLPPLNALRAFEAAARHGSFVAAADELSVTPAAISHQVKALEDRLDVALFRRLARGLALTAEGEALLPDLRDAFDRMALALDRVGRQASARVLTISLVTTFLLAWLVPRLHRFQTKHPDIEVRMTTTRDAVDFGREDIDAAVRFAARPEDGLFAMKLFNDVLTPLCGRRYRDRLKTFDDLRKVPLIDTAFLPEWPIWLEAMGLQSLKPRRSMAFDSTKIAVEAAIEGAGVALGPPDLFREEIEEGRLFQPFPQVVESGKAWWFVCPATTAERPKIKAFRAWLDEELEREAKLGPPASGRQLQAVAGR